MKAAVIYYSRSGVTKKIAEKVRDRFQADMYFVEPEKAYGNYASAVARVIGEKASKKDPVLKTKVSDFSAYDTVFIGFPVWASTIPQFLQEHISKAGLQGKRVIPFATAGANGKESSLKRLKEILPDSTVTGYFYTSMVKKADADVWLNSIEE